MGKPAQGNRDICVKIKNVLIRHHCRQLKGFGFTYQFCCATKETKVARYHAKKFEVPVHVPLVAQGLVLKLTTVLCSVSFLACSIVAS